MDDTITNLKEWDLNQSYGKFNISYESLIEKVRFCISTIIHKYYETIPEKKVHREYLIQKNINEDEVPDYLFDRPLKIIISELSSNSIIKILKGLVFELRAQEVITFNENEKKIFILLFKKIDHANQLRNKIIHSTSSISKSNIRKAGVGKINEPSVSLFSKYEKVSASGLDYQHAIFKISDLEKYSLELQELDGFLSVFTRYINKNELDISEFSGLSKISLEIKHKSQGKQK